MITDAAEDTKAAAGAAVSCMERTAAIKERQI